jgi:hypothetical protein
MRAQLWVCGLMLAAAPRGEMRSERLTMAVSPARSFAPTTLTVRIHVTPDDDNRALEVVAESGDYYRSSRIQLDGKEAPQAIAVELRSLPGGDYEVRGTLIDASGHTRASVRAQAIVIGSTDNHDDQVVE